MRAGQALGVLSAGLGGALLAFPHRVGEAVTGGDSGVPAPWVVRLLGARLVAQGITEITRPTRTVLLLSGITDALHAASMVTLAGLDTTYRRPALTSAAVAGLNATASVALGLGVDRA